MMRVAVYVALAVIAFSVVALVGAKAFLKKSWSDTVKWLFEFFS